MEVKWILIQLVLTGGSAGILSLVLITDMSTLLGLALKAEVPD
jgi:hypothetical protein